MLYQMRSQPMFDPAELLTQFDVLQSLPTMLFSPRLSIDIQSAQILDTQTIGERLDLCLPFQLDYQLTRT
jgi:hypothetical protein